MLLSARGHALDFSSVLSYSYKEILYHNQNIYHFAIIYISFFPTQGKGNEINRCFSDL